MCFVQITLTLSPPCVRISVPVRAAAGGGQGGPYSNTSFRHLEKPRGAVGTAAKCSHTLAGCAVISTETLVRLLPSVV